MRIGMAIVLSVLAVVGLTTSRAISADQTSRYTLFIVAGGMVGGGADGVAMGGSGIYMGRDACLTAGQAIKFGVIGEAADAKPTSITWICVPLGKP